MATRILSRLHRNHKTSCSDRGRRSFRPNPEALEQRSLLSSLSIANAAVLDGTSGTTPMTFNVSLSALSNQPVTVGYTTIGNGTAVAGVDYLSTGGTLTFAPGQTTQTIPVTVVGNPAVRPDVNFTLALSNPTFATIARGVAVGTIVDGHQTLSVGNAAVLDSSSGTTPMTFTVSLSAPSSQPVTVGYTTVGNGTAVAGIDYLSTGGTLTFAPGQTTQTIPVTVVGNPAVRPDVNFTLALSNPTFATIARGVAVGTIVDGHQTLSVGNAAVLDSSSGTTPMTFTVSLSAPSSQPVTVGYTTVGNGTAVAGIDYLSAGVTLTFAPGQTTQSFTVQVVGQPALGLEKTFTVALSNPTFATIARGEAVGTIVLFIPTVHETNTIWSGYVITPGNLVNAVGCTWVQNAVSSTGADSITSFWVGIDGFGGGTVEQIGTTWSAASGYQAWVEFYGDDRKVNRGGELVTGKYYYATSLNSIIGYNFFNIQAGDTISAYVGFVSSTNTTSTFAFRFQDTPRGGTTKAWQQDLTTQYVVPSRTTGEWIVETPNVGSSPLANFGTISFSGAWATAGTTTGPINAFTNYALNMVPGIGGGTDLTSSVVDSSTPGPWEFVGESSGFTVTFGSATRIRPIPPVRGRPPELSRTRGGPRTAPLRPPTAPGVLSKGCQTQGFPAGVYSGTPTFLAALP